MNIGDIGVYNIIKTKNGTIPEKLELDKNGFVKGGVDTFIKVESELYKDWIDSISLDKEEE